VRPAETRLPYTLLVEFDGGVARAALAAGAGIRLKTVDSFETARRELAAQRPDVLVVAFDDPTPRAVVDFKEFRHSGFPPTLVISRAIGDRRVTELIKAGAAGYLFHNEAFRLPNAVRELLRGGIPMSPPVSQLVLGRARRSSSQMAAVRPAKIAPNDLVTDRQREILTLLANGHSYDDIGTALGLSVNTVRTHVRMLYERLGVSTKVEAVVVAMELGLLPRAP
jgi:DNA-binding NarL/FixJ family response regulator